MNALRVLRRPAQCHHINTRVRVLGQSSYQITRCMASRATNKSAIEEVDQCPPATCECKGIPDGLEIDHEGSIRGRMPFYTTHMVACTGQSDWTSKIEDDPKGWLAKDLRENFLPKPGVTQEVSVHPALEVRINDPGLRFDLT